MVYNSSFRIDLEQLYKESLPLYHLPGEEFWWGFEQEFFITKNYRIAGFPAVVFDLVSNGYVP